MKQDYLANGGLCDLAHNHGRPEGLHYDLNCCHLNAPEVSYTPRILINPGLAAEGA